MHILEATIIILSTVSCLLLLDGAEVDTYNFVELDEGLVPSTNSTTTLSVSNVSSTLKCAVSCTRAVDSGCHGFVFQAEMCKSSCKVGSCRLLSSNESLSVVPLSMNSAGCPRSFLLKEKMSASITSMALCPNPQINAQNCSFPFTYGGRLWYNCSDTMTNACTQPFGCLMINRTVAKCAPPADFVAVATNVSANVSGGLTVITQSIFGWIVWMQRVDMSTNWALNWATYKNGFGSIGSSNFWLGLERVHQLTTSGAYRLRVEVQQKANGLWYSAEYWTFVIDDEISNKYRLNVGGFSGDAGDSLQYTGGWTGGDQGEYYHNGMKFTTSDNDNDLSGSNLASSGGGFWYNANYWACTTCAGSNAQWCTMPGGWHLKAVRKMIKLQS